jgi:hypothetical protein
MGKHAVRDHGELTASSVNGIIALVPPHVSPHVHHLSVDHHVPTFIRWMLSHHVSYLTLLTTGARIIAQSLLDNTTLTSVNLRCNEIGISGGEALAALLIKGM